MNKGHIIIMNLVSIAIFMLATGCGLSASDEAMDNIMSRLQRLETRVAAIEVNSDAMVAFKEQGRQFERFMADSETRQADLMLAVARLEEQFQGKTPLPDEATPPDSREKTATSPVSKAGEAPQFYEVQKGDTLYSVSRQHKLEPAVLKKLNGLESEVIVPGQKLRVR